MHETLGIVADDLTGAGDTVVQFSNRGIPSMLNLGNEPLSSEVRVVAVDTASRNLAAEQAAQIAREAAARLKRQGITHFYKKIDSMLRGNFIAELEAIMDELKLETVLVAPAYPANLRITAGGYHLVKQRPVSQSEAAVDPVTPVSESHLPTLIRRKSVKKVGSLDLSVILQGSQAVRSEIRKMQVEGVRIISCDATTDEHLQAIAKILWENPAIMGCGSAGLARAMAGLKGSAPKRPEVGAGGTERALAPLLVVAGTRSPETVAQIEACVKEMTLVRIEIEKLLGAHSQAELEKLLTVVSCALSNGQDTAVYLPADAPVLPGKETSFRLTEILGVLVKAVLARGLTINGLLLTGGDTAKTVCRELGVEAIEYTEELCPAVPAGRLVGGSHSGLKVITKGGACGTPDIISRANDFFKRRG